MFGKRKCDSTPVFAEPVHVENAGQIRAAVEALACPSGAKLVQGALRAPSAAALVKASQKPDAVWMYAQRAECSRCKKLCEVTISQPSAGEAPNEHAVRSKARPDFYALQHAYLPEWFLNRPDEVIRLLTTKLDDWQAQTMRHFGEIVERSPGNPLPITNVQIVGTPGETTAVLVDFIAPRAPVEAHHALLVGGPVPRFFLSEKTHLGENGPLADMAGLTEWTFAKPDKSEMKHTAITLLPEVSRSAFFNAAVELLKQRLA
jgi:hypothetical protein